MTLTKIPATASLQVIEDYPGFISEFVDRVISARSHSVSFERKANTIDVTFSNETGKQTLKRSSFKCDYYKLIIAMKGFFNLTNMVAKKKGRKTIIEGDGTVRKDDRKYVFKIEVVENGKHGQSEHSHASIFPKPYCFEQVV